MLVCCINNKAYFILEQATNTLREFSNVARKEDFSFILLIFGIFCAANGSAVKWIQVLPAGGALWNIGQSSASK